MNDENDNINPFEDANTNSNSNEDNNSINYNTYDDQNNDFGFINTVESFNNEVEEQPSYNDLYNALDKNQEPIRNVEDDKSFNEALKKKIFIIIGIVALVILLITVLLGLIGGNNEPVEENDGDLIINPGEDKNKEKEINTKYELNTIKLANGDVLVKLNNQNNISVDAEVTFEFYGSEGKIIKTEKESIPSIPPMTNYYETVYIGEEQKNSLFETNAKLTLNKYKEYFLDKIKILNQEELEDKILFDIKNEGTKSIDYVITYVLYYDTNDNIIGFDDNEIIGLDADKTTKVEMNYPTDEEYNLIDFSRYEIGINTAYSYKNN